MSAGQPADFCETEVRRHDYDRWLLSLFAPEKYRHNLHGLLAFNLEIARIADQVTQPMLGEIRLQWWRENIEKIFSGTVPDHPVATRLADSINLTPLSRSLIDVLIDAHARDLYPEPPANMTELETYVAATAGAINGLQLIILGISDAASCVVARQIGTAWGLIGLLRSIPGHAQAHRVYLPRDLLQQAGYNIDDYLQGPDPKKIQSISAAIAERAEDQLQQARATRRQVNPLAQPVLLQAELAELYLRRLRNVGFDFTKKTIFPGVPAKQWRLISRTLFRR